MTIADRQNIIFFRIHSEVMSDFGSFLIFLTRNGNVAFVNILFPEHNSATVTNILMVLGRIIEHVNVECRMQ